MGGRLLHNGATILTWNVLFAVAVNEAIRKSSTSGTNVYIEINATFPVHTLDIVNQKSTVNATLTVTVVTTYTCDVSLSPTISNTVPACIANITLPTSVTVPEFGQLRYAIKTLGGAQLGIQPNMVVNLANVTNLPSSVRQIIDTDTMQYETPATGVAFTQFITTISTTSAGHNSQMFGS